SISLNMYPNPTNGETVLEFNLADASSIKVNVVDVTGRVVLNIANTNFAPGEHSISVNENSTLERGVYFVNMTVNGKSLTRKLLIDLRLTPNSSPNGRPLGRTKKSRSISERDFFITFT